MIAVSNTGPFFVRCPLSFSAWATFAGSATRASATAIRRVTSFAPTSTIAGRLSRSRCVRPCAGFADFFCAATVSTADVIHLDLRLVAGLAPQVRAQLAVTIPALQPDVAEEGAEILIGSPAAKDVSETRAGSGEEAGVQHAVG